MSTLGEKIIEELRAKSSTYPVLANKCNSTVEAVKKCCYELSENGIIIISRDLSDARVAKVYISSNDL